MPELPEVETIRRDLERYLPGHSVVAMELRDRRLMSEKTEQFWKEGVADQIWKAIKRKGKYLIVPLSNQWQVIFHLRMTGQLVLGLPNGPALPDQYRMRMIFDHGIQLGFYDQRRFGEVFILKPGETRVGIEKLGPDPLNELTPMDFSRLIRQKTTRIKPLLMDQYVIAGVGNIYAQEALFKAGIRPTRSAKCLTHKEAELLYTMLKETLLIAIDHRGSTNRNYRDAFGRQGAAQTLHFVYRKGGQPCLRCQSVLKETRVGGRGTVYCPTCQH